MVSNSVIYLEKWNNDITLLNDYGVSKHDYNDLIRALDQTIVLERSNRYDEAKKMWHQYLEILSKYVNVNSKRKV